AVGAGDDGAGVGVDVKLDVGAVDDDAVVGHGEGVGLLGARLGDQVHGGGQRGRFGDRLGARHVADGLVDVPADLIVVAGNPVGLVEHPEGLRVANEVLATGEVPAQRFLGQRARK